MTEAEWLKCKEPTAMLLGLGVAVGFEQPTNTKGSSQTNARERKLRLFAAACCRQIWHMVGDERSRTAVEVAELFADERASDEELSIAEGAAWDVVRNPGAIPLPPRAWASLAAICASRKDARWSASSSSLNAARAVAWIDVDNVDGEQLAGIQMEQAAILRCIFGNPFRPTTLDPAWRTPSVLQLAQVIYHERRFDLMPILGDALEDARCTSADMLRHCRAPGEHVRGCWVVDLLLAKE